MGERGAMELLLVVVLCLVVTDDRGVSAQWFDCQQLEEDSWAAFVSVINRDPEFAVFCPFHIRGEKCGDIATIGYEVPPDVETYIMCDDHYSNKECIIDCPGRHFTVGTGGRLTIDRLTLRGASKSSVRVDAGGELTTYRANFERNKNSDGRGGAIDAGPNTVLRLQGGRLVRNRAQSGGAVNYLGRAEFHEVTFEQNFAESYNGGAIFAGVPDDMVDHADKSHTTFIGRNTFVGNYARNYGPAFFNEREELSQNPNRFGVTHSGVNEGCGNRNKNNVECNGIFEFKSTKCEPFEIQCDRDVEETGAPTVGPTVSPTTNRPTSTPSWNPSREPSTEPTTHPSSMPSLGPTASPTVHPTFEPTNFPTDRPTTSFPTTEPSAEKTRSPTGRPTFEATGPPSMRPSVRPSESKTRYPTMAPSAEPTFDPSDKPSATFVPPSQSPIRVPVTSPPVLATSTAPPQATTKASKGETNSEKKEKGEKVEKGGHSRRRHMHTMSGLRGASPS